MRKLFETKDEYNKRMSDLQKEKRYSDALKRLKSNADWDIVFDEYLNILIEAKKDQLAELVSAMNPMLESDVVDKYMVQKQLMILMGIRNFVSLLENEGVGIDNAINSLTKLMREE